LACDEAMIDDAVTSDPIEGVVAVALALGVELDVDEARDWMAAVSRQATDPLVVDVNSGVYGHQVTMSDLDPAEVGRYRHVARIVGFEDRPPEVRTALALSGSAAQNRVHRFPRRLRLLREGSHPGGEP
jgi:hypothetical protein